MEPSTLQANSAYMPFNSMYPNSEYIAPPLDKEKLRVVEPSTRASVKLDLMKKWHKLQEQRFLENLNVRLRAYINKEYEQGSIIDISI